MHILLKRLSFLIAAITIMNTAMGQLKTKVKCPDLYVDILNGTVNDQKPNYGHEEIKGRIPCFTSAVSDASPDAKCGGLVSYKDKDVYFYTKRHYIEVGPKFVGKSSIAILGTKRGSLFQTLGNPKMKEELWDAYDTQYGILILHYDVKGAAGKVKMFQMSTETTETIELCE